MTPFLILDIDPALLDAERARVIPALRAALPHAEVFEVGSTAIPGVIGKGDLDILARAPLERFDETRAALDALHPRNPDQLSNAQYQGYAVDSPLDVAIQLTVTGGAYDDFEPFLEALRADPSLIEAYNTLKRRWHGRPMDDYRAAKRAFIEAVLTDLKG
ncbi:MAG: GrpB family protein [Alphaproteobacteria bacterium]|nr:GrpB family protein [Alphaproteobacteria bacterium]